MLSSAKIPRRALMRIDEEASTLAGLKQEASVLRCACQQSDNPSANISRWFNKQIQAASVRVFVA
jgi:hypothetical protein